MFSLLLNAIKGIAIFMVICEAILHFTPTKNYGKYIKPIIGFIILSKIMIAIFSFNNSGINKQMEETLDKYEEQLQGMEITNLNSQTFDITEQIKMKLNKDLINEYEVKKALIVQETDDSGIIRNILKITLGKDNKSIVVEKINIGTQMTKEELQMKTVIAQTVGMEQKDVEVVIEG